MYFHVGLRAGLDKVDKQVCCQATRPWIPTNIPTGLHESRVQEIAGVDNQSIRPILDRLDQLVVIRRAVHVLRRGNAVLLHMRLRLFRVLAVAVLRDPFEARRSVPEYTGPTKGAGTQVVHSRKVPVLQIVKVRDPLNDSEVFGRRRDQREYPLDDFLAERAGYVEYFTQEPNESGYYRIDIVVGQPCANTRVHNLAV